MGSAEEQRGRRCCELTPQEHTDLAAPSLGLPAGCAPQGQAVGWSSTYLGPAFSQCEHCLIWGAALAAPGMGCASWDGTGWSPSPVALSSWGKLSIPELYWTRDPLSCLHLSWVHPQHCVVSPAAGAHGSFCMMCTMQNHTIQAFANSGNAIKPLSIIRDLKSKEGCPP